MSSYRGFPCLPSDWDGSLVTEVNLRIEDRIEELKRNARLCDDVGCPGDESHCKNGCLYRLDIRDLEAKLK